MPAQTGSGLDRKRLVRPLLAACRAEQDWLNSKARIWVALSGGADSTALLRTMVSAGLSAPIGVTHIDHGVQPESKQWAAHCVALGTELGVHVNVHQVTAPTDGQYLGGFEAWARAQRYGHWRELVQSNEVLLSAHHADDQAETVALRLLQGRLPLPMPVRRRLGEGVLWRPFLGLRAGQLRAALATDGHSWFEDPSNKDTGLLRNKVRQLLPRLEQFAGGATESSDGATWHALLNRCGGLVARLHRALGVNLGVSPSARSAELLASQNAGELGRVPLAILPGPVALQGVLALFASGPVSRGQARDALSRLRQQAAAGEANGAARGGVLVGQPVPDAGPDGDSVSALMLFVAETDLVIWREPYFATMVLDGQSREDLRLPHGTLMVEFGSSVAAPDPLDKADGCVAAALPEAAQLVVRPLATADRLLHKGRLRPVKELLRGAGVPRWARKSYPVVAVGTRILAVPAPNAPVSSAPASETGWLRDGGGAQVPIRVRWQTKLPS